MRRRGADGWSRRGLLAVVLTVIAVCGAVTPAVASPTGPAIDRSGDTRGSLAAGTMADAGAGQAPGDASVGSASVAQVSTTATTLSQCREITSAGVYELAGNLTNKTGGDCIVVRANDVTIDGNGFVITGGGASVGIEDPSGLTDNVTVRDVRVRNFSTGVGLSDGAVVRNVTVTTADGTTPTVGVVVSGTAVRIDDVTVDTRTESDLTKAVDVSGVSNGTITDVTAGGITPPGDQRNITVGLDVQLTENLTVDGFTLEDYSIGVLGFEGTNLTVRNGTVSGATVGVNARDSDGLSTPVESGLVENVTVDGVDGRIVTGSLTFAPKYVGLDGTNNLTVRDLRTPNATVAAFSGTNVSLTRVRETPLPPRPVEVGRANVTNLGASPSATVAFQYDERRLMESSVAAYRRFPSSWGTPIGATVDTIDDEVSLSITSGGTYGVFANDTTISRCTTITSPGVYELAGDLTNKTGGDCIRVGADDLTIDGNGYTVTGGGFGIGIGEDLGVSRNVTVRDVTVRNFSTGVELTDGAVVRNVDVTTADITTATAGVRIRGFDFRIDDVRVDTRTPSDGSRGIDVSRTENGTITDVTALGASPSGTQRNVTIGLDVQTTDNVTVDGFSVVNHSIGVLGFRAANVSIGNGTIRGAIVGVNARAPDSLTVTVESGLVENVTIDPVDGRLDLSNAEPLAAKYVGLDGTNSLTVRDLRTPNATIAEFSGTNVSLTPVRETPAAPRSVEIGRANVTELGTSPSATVGFRYDERRLVESTVAAYRAGPFSWSPPITATLDTTTDKVTLTTTTGETVGAFANDTSLARCTRLTSPGVYELAQDLETANASCIEIASPNVTVDGAGHEIVGNGTDFGVENVAFAANATVRNLTVRNVSTGVFLNDPAPSVRNVTATGVETGIDVGSTTDPVVEDVRVDTATGPVSTTGIDASRTDRPRIRNATVRSLSTGRQTFGVSAFQAANGSFTDVTVESAARNVTVGLDIGASRNLTVEAVTVDNYSYGVFAEEASDLSLRDSTVDNTTVGLGFDEFGGGADAVTETGTVENVTVGPVSGRIEASGLVEPARYVQLDGSNGVTIEGLTTPNATATVSGTSVSLAPVAATPAPPKERTVGRVNLTARGTGPDAVVGFGYDEGGLQESTVDVFAAGPTAWATPSGTVTRDLANDTVLLQTSSVGTYGAFANNSTLTGCTRIEGAGAYTLDGDVTASGAGTCVAINGSDVTVDGNGATLTGPGSGRAVGVVRPGLTNVTVRNLTARNWTTGVGLNRTDGVAIADVTTRDVGIGVNLNRSRDGAVKRVNAGINASRAPQFESVGARLSGAINLRADEIDVFPTGASPYRGLTVNGSRDLRLRSVEIAGATPAETGSDAGVDVGVAAGSSRNLSVDRLFVSGFAVSLSAGDARNHSVRDVILRDVTAGLRVDGRTPAVTETGTYSDVSIQSVTSPGATYVRLDGSNDVRLTSLQTPNATLTTLRGTNVTLAPVGPTPAPPQNVSVGLVNLTSTGSSPTATVGFGYDPGRLREPTIDVYQLGFPDWESVQSGTIARDPANDTITLSTTSMRTYGTFADGADVTGCTRIASGGVYDVTGDLSTGLAPGATCIAVNASDVTIDGNGRTLTANGTGTAVGVVRSGLTNVTVRNLTIRDADVGVQATGTTNGTIRDVRVVNTTTGVDADGSSRVVVESSRINLTSTGVDGDGIRARASSNGSVTGVTVLGQGNGDGFDVLGASNLTVDGVRVEGDLLAGVVASGSRLLTVRDTTTDGIDTGVALSSATNATVTNVTVRNAQTGVLAVQPLLRTQTVETISVFGLTVRNVDRYATADASSDLTIFDLRTDNGTISFASVENATLDSPGVTPTRPAAVDLGRFAATNRSDDARVIISLPYDSSRVRESAIDLYEASGGNWTLAALSNGSTVTVDEQNEGLDVTLVGNDATGTYGGFAAANTISQCTRIDEAGVYTLTGNLTANASGPCVAVNASGVTVDGAGYTISGNDSATGVAAVRDGLANVTVRDLSVVGLPNGDGVELEATTDATVRNVSTSDVTLPVNLRMATAPTLVDATLQGSGNVNLAKTSDAAVRNVSMRAEGSTAVTLNGASNATVRRLSTEGGVGALNGLLLLDSDAVTLDRLRVSGIANPVVAAGATDLQAKTVTLSDGSGGLAFVNPFTGRTAAVESATVRNLTVTDPTSAQPTYLTVDDTNDVRVRDVQTPNASLARFEATNVTLAGVDATPPAPRAVTVGRVNLSAYGPTASATATLGYDPTAVNESTVAAYRVDPANGTWDRVTAGSVSADATNDTVTLTGVQPGTYGVFADAPAGQTPGGGTGVLVDACTRIETAGVYDLTGNLTANASGPCVAINASDVTVDGNGYTISGNDSATGVAAVRDGLANVTVHNLSVAGLSSGTGVELDRTTDATVRNVSTRDVRSPVSAFATTTPTVRDAALRGSGGVNLGASTDATVRNATLVVGDGLDLTVASNATVSDVSVAGDPLAAAGVVAGASDNVTLRRLTVTDTIRAVEADSATDLRVTDTTIADSQAGLLFVNPFTGRTADVESATVENLTVSGFTTATPPYVRVDDTNDVVVRNVSTPNATLASVTGRNVTLGRVDVTPAAPRNVTAGRVNLSAVGPNASATVSVRYNGTAVNESTVAAYRIDRANGSWTRLTATATVDASNDTATLAGVRSGTYGVFADGNRTSGGNGSLPLGERLFPNGVPGSSTGLAPIDDDGDGLLEDVTGDGRFSFEDVIEFVFSIQRNPAAYDSLSAAQTDALDHSDDGRVSFTDVIDLVFELQNR